MIDNRMVEDIVREVFKAIGQGNQIQVTNCPTKNSLPTQGPYMGLVPDRDYPLATKRSDLVKTPTGKSLDQITLDSVIKGEVNAEDVRITPETLRLQAEIADGVERPQFANNLRRAAELTAIPDARLLEMYNALRPYRSSKKELMDMAQELEQKFNAKINAAFIREAADVYERRNRLKAE